MITVLEVDYENPWIYEGRPFTSDDIGDYYGFIYCITNTSTGRKYIGRKYFVQKRNPLPPHNPWKSKLRRDKTTIFT